MMWYINEAQTSASFSFSTGGDTAATTEKLKAFEEKENSVMKFAKI